MPGQVFPTEELRGLHSVNTCTSANQVACARQGGSCLSVYVVLENGVVVEGINFGGYAEEHEWIKTTLTKWGGGKTDFQDVGGPMENC